MEMEEVREPTLVQTLRAHSSEVTCVDACGARLATGGGDRALRVWAWRAGAGWEPQHRVARAHRYSVTAARWATGGALLASAGVDGVLRVWSAELAPRRTLAAPGAAAVRAMCWAGRARLLAGHDDGALAVWHVPRAALLARLEAHAGALHAVATLSNHAFLLTACTEGVLKVFDLAEVCRSGGRAAALSWVDAAHDLGALCAEGSEDGAQAATGGHDALVRVWHAAGGRVQAAGTLGGHAAAVTALRWAAGGALLASCSLDRTLRLWAPASAACLHVLHAHPRYLTCLAFDLRHTYVVTGSNDKSVKMWSLGVLSLDSELVVPCAALAHFGLGDLQGIEPVEEDGSPEVSTREQEVEEGGARRVWSEHAHSGAVNCIAAAGDIVASASSDGTVRVWSRHGTVLSALHTLDAHQYPAMTCDLGSAAALLLSAGLDGRACLWDVETGVQLRELCAREAGAGEGGGGVRGARIGPQRPPLLLLATDDGNAPLWSLADSDPTPKFVYGGCVEAATCCAWSHDGRVAAIGAASGELRVLAPPASHDLHYELHAHDLGVQGCDFAPPSDTLDLPEGSYLLATAGCDDLIKLWAIEYDEAGHNACVRLSVSVAAHGGSVTSVRWSGALLASAGADGWARVWRLEPAAGPPALAALAAVPPAGAGGALCAALASSSLLLVGSLTGAVSAWRLPDVAQADDTDDDASPACLWSVAAVLHWLRENVTRTPGSSVSREREAELVERVRQEKLNGSRLLNGTLEELLHLFGYGDEDAEESGPDGDGKESGDGSEKAASYRAVRALLLEELQWLRRAPLSLRLEATAPHSLLCPLSHRLLRCPVRAADGFSYERANILDWLLANEAGVSPMSGRRLSNTRVLPNYALRDTLRAFLAQHDDAQHTFS